MTEDGRPLRHHTYIDIPDSLRLPHFMLADDKDDQDDHSRLSTDYKLVLQSVICHKGESLTSGHYYTFARMAPKVLKDNRRHDFDPPPDYEQAQWVKFDDMADERVQYIDDVRQALKDHMPYLLFYQVVPMYESASSDGEGEPPSYDELGHDMDTPPTPTSFNKSPSKPSKKEPIALVDSYFTSARAAASGSIELSEPPSIKLSFEADRLHSRDGDTTAANPSLTFTKDDIGDSRRRSVVTIDSVTGTPGTTPAVTPDGNSPMISPIDESSSSRLSRAASRFTKSRTSRTSSQPGDGRLAVTMNRLGGLMKTNAGKEALGEPPHLNISGVSSTSSSLVASEAARPANSELFHESYTQVQHVEHAHKGHGRGKSKEKNRHKGDTQPDRECGVM